jgi:hypothetical protein
MRIKNPFIVAPWYHVLGKVRKISITAQLRHPMPKTPPRVLIHAIRLISDQILARLGAIVLLRFFFSSVSSPITGSMPFSLSPPRNSFPKLYPTW